MDSIEKEEFVIFFSWQSDIKENKSLINKALERAQESLSQSYTNFSFKVDEATRDVPGAPNIAESIQNKIQSCDIFVCDITPIDQKQEVPNPNVMFELGYAVNCIGWNRIILLLNTAIASDSGDVFDIKSHRFETFKTLTPENFNNEVGQLYNKLLQTTKTIITNNPPKYLFEHKLQKKIERERDIRTLKMIFAHCFCFSYWDNYYENYPRARWDTDMKIVWDYFAGIYNAVDFYIYDKFISQRIEVFAKTTDEVFCISRNLFDDGRNGLSIALHWDQNDQKEFEKSVSLMYKSQELLMEMIHYIKENFFEIDLDKTSQESYLFLNGKKEASLKALGLLP